EVPHLLATELEQDGNRFTGRVAGIPCFREGKLSHLREWLYQENITPAETWFYSDSQNDLPLLEYVDHPVAVNPDPVLTELALRRGWPVMQLRCSQHIIPG
ncbi:MAG: HAD family hydrolase, partial [Gammaproteobacteria bacterium]